MGREKITNNDFDSPEGSEEDIKKKLYNERLFSRSSVLAGAKEGETAGEYSEPSQDKDYGEQEDRSEFLNQGDDVKDEDQGAVYQRMSKMREKRREIFEKAGIEKKQAKDGGITEKKINTKGDGIIAKYRKIKVVIRAIKMFALVGTSLGDVFVSLGTLFLTINIEFIYSKINKKYPFDSFDRIMFFIGWGVILSILTVLFVFFAVFYEVIQNPLKFMIYGL